MVSVVKKGRLGTLTAHPAAHTNAQLRANCKKCVADDEAPAAPAPEPAAARAAVGRSHADVAEAPAAAASLQQLAAQVEARVMAAMQQQIVQAVAIAVAEATAASKPDPGAAAAAAGAAAAQEQVLGVVLRKAEAAGRAAAGARSELLARVAELDGRLRGLELGRDGADDAGAWPLWCARRPC
jgi:hypothetical protein